MPDWDLAFSLTEGREVINPRPRDEAAIFRYYQPGSIGFITYSEGCNDDVNKFIWSSLGWDPGADVDEILRQYARAFIGRSGRGTSGPVRRRACSCSNETGAGPLVSNDSVERTLGLFRRARTDGQPGCHGELAVSAGPVPGLL